MSSTPSSTVRRPALLGLFWGALAGASPALQAGLDARARIIERRLAPTGKPRRRRLTAK